MIKGKAKVSPKVKTKERVSLRLGQTIHTTRVLGTISLGISSLGINRTPMTPRAKEKARKVKTKVKVIKVKVVKLPMLSLMLGLKNAQEQPAATATGDQLEPELTALFTLEDTMAPKSERREESEPRRGRSPRRANLQPKSKETVTRGALMMAQQALVSASGSNEELYGQMISQA